MPISRSSALRPPPGQTSLAARLAAPDQADQVGGTLTIDQFDAWLHQEIEAARANMWHSPPDESLADEVMRCASDVRHMAQCRAALELLCRFGEGK